MEVGLEVRLQPVATTRARTARKALRNFTVVSGYRPDADSQRLPHPV